MTALTDQIAAVVARHSPITGLGYSRTRCGCGEVFTRPYVKSHAAHVAEQIEAATPELGEVQKLLAVWTEGLVTDKEAYWRLREILRPKETNQERISTPKVVRL